MAKTSSPTIVMRRLTRGASLPSYASEGAAGMDLRADLSEFFQGHESPENGVIWIEGGERRMIRCGFAMSLPKGYEAQVRSRSGLAMKHGIVVLNSPGTIDSDYRGEVCVILHNVSESPFQILHGDRIAQMVIAKHEVLKIEETEDDLDVTDRGEGGFGSTGVK